MKNNINLEQILQELANNQKGALEQLFNYFYPRLYKFSKAFLKLEEGIDDILQEVFLKIWHNRKKIDNPNTFNAYIFTITRNLLLNELRSRLNDQKYREKILKECGDNHFLLSENIEYQELKGKVDAMVLELPDRQREVFMLSRFEGLSHKEIAQKLGITQKTVEYHIHQSIGFLKGRLKELGLIPILYLYLFL